jgi:hypothetical protein
MRLSVLNSTTQFTNFHYCKLLEILSLDYLDAQFQFEWKYVDSSSFLLLKILSIEQFCMHEWKLVVSVTMVPLLPSNLAFPCFQE